MRSPSKSRGIHVVIDGPDGVGITTQCNLLATYLRTRGIPCAQTAEPSEGPVGQMLRRMLLHKEPALPPAAMQMAYVADRISHGSLVVEPALARGEVVVQARGEWSTVVYNAARGVTEGERDNLARTAFGWHEEIEIPTLTILLVAELGVTEARRTARGGEVELFDASDFQARVISLYEDAYNLVQLDWSMRYERAARNALVVIDADAKVLEVHERVLAAILAAGIIHESGTP